jgi:hypothetical protein
MVRGRLNSSVLRLTWRRFRLYLRSKTALKNLVSPQFALQHNKHGGCTVGADGSLGFAQTFCCNVRRIS